MTTLLDKATATKELEIALRDGSKLTQTDPESGKHANRQHEGLKSVLESRLSRFYSSRSQKWNPEDVATIRDVELLTARETLAVIERIQSLLAIEDDTVVPVIGTRDLSQIRTLLSLVFKWGTEPLVCQVKEAWPVNSPALTADSPARISDVSNLSENYILLVQLTRRVLGLILPAGEHGKLSQSLITTTLLERHLVDILHPALVIGWLPKSLSTDSVPVVDSIRPLIMRLLKIAATAQAIASLGNILSDPHPLSLHVYRACTSLLSRQVLRQDGVKGLFGAVFGEEETLGGDITIEKLEHVSTLLNTVPAKTKPQDYFEHVIPRIIAMLSETTPPTYRRAAAFAISRMLREGDAPVLHSLKKSIIFRLLHQPLLRIRDERLEEHELQQLERLPTGSMVQLRPDVTLNVLLALLSNADPSPSFISDLLSPITPALYSLLYHLHKVKTSDPKLKETLHGMLLTWGKIVDESQGVEILLSIVNNGQDGGWEMNLEGHIRLLPETEHLASLSLLTPEQVPEAVDFEDLNFDSNIFDLYPDPLHFVKLLKNIDRGDISSGVFVRLLESYRAEKSQSSGDSLRILLHLQIIMQMQKQLSEGTSSNILKKPQQMLTFIHHVLQSANSIAPEPQLQKRSSLEDKLRIIPDAEEAKEEIEFEDSDDDMLDSEAIGPDDELIETAINLLLAALEADEDLSARTMPVLDDIFSLLEPLSREGSSSVMPLAREARLVMMARLASTSQPRTAKYKTEEEESAQELYQKALKLLQDPILPVRAHGLLLLRQLVTPSRSKGKEQGIRALDPALAPAIMSIFLQSVQDEDSYIFLNSVQGLAAMVDGLGKEVLTGLVHEYVGNLPRILGEVDASAINQQEIDVRTRVGEALSIVIKRCGDALGIYVDNLIPPLFDLIRAHGIPTTLRTSALSLLADCVNTYSLAVLTYTEDLAAAMVDLLQVESVPIRQHVNSQGSRDTSKKVSESPREDTAGEKVEDGTKKLPETMDDTPTSTNSKFPPLRRAALHLLGLLVKEATRHAYESLPSSNSFISQALIQRATTTLGYISVTDEDNIVRVMAREVREGLEDIQRARMGL